ncbi:ATP-binding protein [Nonomuraea sp. NPDC055795]
MVAVTAVNGHGSGYAVGPRLVLTSAHVVGSVDARVEVFRPGHPERYGGRVVWSGNPGGRDDAALVAIEDPGWTPPTGAPIRWGRTLTFRPGIACESWGLAALAQREQRPAELLQPSGTLNPGDGYVGDRYAMAVSGTAPQRPADGSSPWAGMSGAALFCGDLLAGVIAVDPAMRAHGHLEAVPAYVLHHDAGFRRALADHHASPSPGGYPKDAETRISGVVLEPIEFQHLAEAANPTAPGTDGGSPAALLRARRQVVPLHGREKYLRQLHAWARMRGFGATLIYGAGGQGKTRLAQHLTVELTATGWGTLWLAAHAPTAELAIIKDSASPLLVIIDYAESRASQMIALLEAAARREEASALKVLMLARTASSWWEALQAATSVTEAMLDSAPVILLDALEPDPVAQGEAYQTAVRAFAHALDAQSASSATPAAGESFAGEPREYGTWTKLAESLPRPAGDVTAAGDGVAGVGNALTLHMPRWPTYWTQRQNRKVRVSMPLRPQPEQMELKIGYSCTNCATGRPSRLPMACTPLTETV